MKRVLRPVGAALLLVLVASSFAGADPGSAVPGAQKNVIVQAPGAEQAAATAVVRMGGRVTQALPIVEGFAASIPADAVEQLAAVRGVRAVTDDVALHPTKKPGSPPGTQPNSVFRTETQATTLADAGYTGEGVEGNDIRVALIDTGIDTQVAATGDLAGRVLQVASPIPGESNLVDCVNFSGEVTCDDTFGHGTFMAGLIAGSGAASDGKYAGVATDAELISVKVGGADGSADVSKVLAGIQWVVSFADEYDIRVLNLSLGTDSTAPTNVDPLNFAVRRAWVSGIAVVVSAGNFGRGPRTRPDGTPYGTVTKPGDDPFVITVGSVDDVETPAIADDRLPGFSSWGPTFENEAKPDVVAPGGRVVGLRAPGSVIDAMPGTLDATYRRGSGTSMSAAVTSGLVAQLLDAHPDWTPDHVKAALIQTAAGVATNDARAVGAGLVQGDAARTATVTPTPPSIDGSTALGSLSASRGTNLVLSCVSQLLGCTLLPPEHTAQGRNWQGVEYTVSSWTSTSWYLSQWVDPAGRNWQTSTWPSGRNWQGTGWQGSTWYDGRADKKSYGKATNGSGSYGAWG